MYPPNQDRLSMPLNYVNVSKTKFPDSPPSISPLHQHMHIYTTVQQALRLRPALFDHMHDSSRSILLYSENNSLHFNTTSASHQRPEGAQKQNMSANRPTADPTRRKDKKNKTKHKTKQPQPSRRQTCFAVSNSKKIKQNQNMCLVTHTNMT